MALAWLLVCGGVGAAVVFEAEDAALKTVGHRIGGGWNLHSHGTVGEFFRVGTAGTYTVRARAYGSPLGGVWPTMAVVVDGAAGPSATVDSTEYADYELEVALSPGLHMIGVAFLNDARNESEDRNLYLDWIEVCSPEGVAEPVKAGTEEWAVEGEKREKAVLERTDEAIREHRMGTATVTVLDGDGAPVPDVAVAVNLVRHDFLFGCNIYMFDRFPTAAENAAYKQRFEELFNYATVGFYWKSFEPQQGRPRYAYMDKVVAWCRDRGIRCKGHPLLWDHEAGVPPWSDGQPPRDVQKARVEAVMRRYEGRIEFWEVVNEPAHVRGIAIEEPYRWARAASPAAYLIVNDYAVFADGCPPFLELLQEAQAAGVPFDGVGIQAHEPANMAFPLDRVQAILDGYAALGKELHITEFTLSSNGREVIGGFWRGRWDEAQQAQYAEDLYRVCFAHPAVVGITWWDLCDQGSWRKHGGMLRADVTPKPVYERLKRLVHEEWHTELQGTTDGSGRFAFSGFHGRYRVTTRRAGRSQEAEFLVRGGQENTCTVVLAEE